MPPRKKSPAQLDAEIARALGTSKPRASREAIDPAKREEITEAAYAVFYRPGGEDLTRAEFHEEVLGLLRGFGLFSAPLEKQLDALYKHIYGG
jgi:hypothetical protein